MTHGDKTVNSLYAQNVFFQLVNFAFGQKGVVNFLTNHWIATLFSS